MDELSVQEYLIWVESGLPELREGRRQPPLYAVAAIEGSRVIDVIAQFSALGASFAA